jgi:hypothetical protein
MAAVGDAYISGSQMAGLLAGVPAPQELLLVMPLGTGPSGSVNVNMVGGNISLSASLGSTVDQGNPNTLGSAWPVKVSDGVGSAVITGSALSVGQMQPSRTVLTQISASVVGSFVVLSASNRIRFDLFNNASASLWVALGPGASLSNWSFTLPTLNMYESPTPAYNGIVTGWWVGVTSGTVQITELFQ